MMGKSQPYRILISGGGTGGHIFPAIAIADQIREWHPDTRFLFVGARGRMEMEKVPAAGYDIEGLWISGLQRRLTLGNLLFPVKVAHSLLKARGILRKFKPQVVVGVGGYASGPLLWAATGMKIPALIQEQNSYAGITNRMLAKRVDRICVAYEGMDRYFPGAKIVVTGNPVRKDLQSAGSKRAEAMTFFGLDPGKKTLLAIGGSLGARTINRSILSGLPLLRQSGVQLIWQCGRFYYGEMKAAIEGADNRHIHLREFIREMDLAYAAADVVLARAGALSVSELCLTGKPSILVPSPNVAEDHQTKNARALVQLGAARMIPDAESEQRLLAEALQLLADERGRRVLSQNISAQARPGAAEQIAHEILTLIP
jgi:UDP-N-acetylglucosamine--N-acetylmuramyl-(pentapeptide) pyrophosphoryl-undecaprenol N-acetylglucosamine transferase